MSVRSDIAVVGLGARVATGLDALTTAMSIRARKSFVRETRFVDSAGEPIALATLASVSEELVGRDRFVALAAPALTEALGSWRARRSPAPLSLLLAAPSDVDPLDVRGDKLLAALAEASGVAIDPARSRVLPHGRAAGAIALEQAVARLSRGEDEAIVVGGVDSYFDPDRLEALDRVRRLHAPSTENGFIPGEGAAFVVLTPRRLSGTAGSFGGLVSVATEREPRPFGSEEPSHALGMSLAMKKVLAPVRSTRIGWALTDVVGERHRVDEWLFVSGRVQSSLSPDFQHDTPLMITGDVGAASATLLVALACVGWNVGAAPHELALVAVHSDDAERGALLLTSEGA